MQINASVLRQFKACESGYQNFINVAPNFDGTFLEVLDLPGIPYNDKIWLARKVFNTNQLIHFAILSAESVLNIYESRFPTDKRITDCLSFMKTIVDFSSLSNDQREKLISLRQGAYQARNAAYAAADAADAAYAAADAADAADAYAADAYAGPGVMTRDEARTAQQQLNLEFLKMAASL